MANMPERLEVRQTPSYHLSSLHDGLQFLANCWPDTIQQKPLSLSILWASIAALSSSSEVRLPWLASG